MPTEKGSLTIAGCGLHPGHMTLETKALIENAEKVLLVAPNPLSVQHIIGLNSNTEHLGRFYNEKGISRPEIYHKMAMYMVGLVRGGSNVVTIFYGHPGVFVTSTREASQILRKENYKVNMLPGISADACLFADFDLDPADTGCQSHEATRFLLTNVKVDPTSALILWQLGLTGEHTNSKFKPGQKGLEALCKRLLEYYPEDHKVCIYEAPTLPGFDARKDWITIQELVNAEIGVISTLLVPAAFAPEFVDDRLDWLGLEKSDTRFWEKN